MSALHEKLLAAVSPPAGTLLSDLDPNAWLAALRAVVELHAPRGSRCAGCRAGCGESQRWPCSTIQAIARELGVDGG